MLAHSKVPALLGFLGSVLLACAGADSTESSEEELRRRRIDEVEAKQLWESADYNCAGNDNGRFARFDPRTFDAAAIMAKVKDDDRDAMGVGCFGDHAYSSSKASAIEMFNKHLTDNEWDDRTCLEEHLSRPQLARLRLLVSDATNLGVFASVYDGHGDGNSEACAFYTFHVFRADGVHVELTFNHTD